MTGLVPAPIARQAWQMLFPLFTLIGFGALVLFSAAAGSWDPYASSHLLRFGVFLVMAFVLSLFPRDFIQFMALPVYVVVLLMLLAVEAIGFVGGGSQRWLNLGFMQLQPSELMKPAVVLILARYYASLPVGMIPTWSALIAPGAMILTPVALVLLQPDLGTSLAIVFGGAMVMFAAGLPLRWFVGAAAAGAVLAPVAFFFGLQPYQQKRVFTFLDPESDPLGDGYHITQSKIAIGSGGIWGKGFLQGTQSHLDYLPEGHTDFVFATMAEEWGLLGGILMIGAFLLLFRWGLRVSMRTQDKFARMAAAGLTTTIFFYVAINLMMVMGLAPVVGIPLPFMSYGGSSMLTVMLCIGIIMAIDRSGKRQRRPGDWA